jgi:hypothetical protein
VAAGKAPSKVDGDPPVGPKAKGQKKAGSSKDPIEQENPLRARGVPRSNQLSEEDRTALRKFFGIPERTEMKDFKSLPKAERKKIRKSQSLPPWAIAVVIRDRKYLKQILDKKLDKDGAMSVLRTAPSNEKSSCSQEWVKLKSRFEKVSLLQNPRTGQQKAFRKAYDALAKKYPNNPALPKPRKGEGAKGEGTGDQKGKSKGQGQKPEAILTSADDSIKKLMNLMMIKMVADMSK